ncbi:hypothetical protein L1282_000577 [Chryseobacterium sp. HSC-36S06]|nr:hypothetical protein [Chryseobacterium sp. HSC-36S06]
MIYSSGLFLLKRNGHGSDRQKVSFYSNLALKYYLIYKALHINFL